MSGLRKRWVLLRHPHATIRFEGPVYLGPGFSLDMRDGGSFIVGPGVEFRRNFRAEVSGDGEIHIGAGSSLTYDVLIQCTTKVKIGPECLLAQSVIVVDGSHRFRDLTKPVLAQGYDFRPIEIGAGASIMSKVTVIESIGERSFIGANAVVTKPIPAFSIAVGVPATVVEYFGPLEGDD